MSEQHPNTEPTEKEPIFWKNGKRYLRLFYFMPAQHLFDILTNDEIKASIPEECNDPLEFLSLTRVDDSSEKREDGGFISFSSRSDSSLMWAHYADSHRGVCLQFDFPVVEEGAINTPHEGNVYYEYYPNERPRFAILALENPSQFSHTNIASSPYQGVVLKIKYTPFRPYHEHSRQNGISYFTGSLTDFELNETYYTKSDEWKYEKEWRLIITLSKAHSFRAPAFFVNGLTKHLTGIILGTKYPTTLGISWSMIVQALKQNPHFRHVDDISHMLTLYKAEYQQDIYRMTRRV